MPPEGATRSPLKASTGGGSGSPSRRQPGLAGASRGAVDRAMRTLGLKGFRWVKKLRTTVPGPDRKRGGDLLNRDFFAPASNRM